MDGRVENLRLAHAHAHSAPVIRHPYTRARPRRGFKDGCLHKEACTFINRRIMDKALAENTALQAARSLVAWLDFCEAIEIDWTFASDDELILFRDAHLTGISPATGRPYSASTVKTRMVYVVQFCNFAFDQGWMTNAVSRAGVGAVENVPIDRCPLAHIRRGRRARQEPRRLAYSRGCRTMTRFGS